MGVKKNDIHDCSTFLNRGGLDVVKDQTGAHSVYTTFEEHEIMFHVSTMLPHSKEDRQQVSGRDDIANYCAQLEAGSCRLPESMS